MSRKSVSYLTSLRTECRDSQEEMAELATDIEGLFCDIRNASSEELRNESQVDNQLKEVSNKLKELNKRLKQFKAERKRLQEFF